MAQYLIIVARDRPNLFQHLRERHASDVQVILDRRHTARSRRMTAQPTYSAWHTSLERDGYIVVPTR